MAEKTVQIALGGPAELLEYQLSSGESFRPQTITALLDGSGAAADFALQTTFYSPSGEVLARVRTDDTVAVGDSAEATVAPF